MAGRIWGAAAVAALVFASLCGSALAAPPTDPPGKSGEAPGHQKEDGSPAKPTPPGQAKADENEPQTVVAEAPVQPAVTQQAPEPAAPSASPRFENASGKPKLNVPPAAEAAPESSVSAPGNSGRHKVTICHKGHAITVDVHAARAHVDGHGDTYAVAGAKGRAACPHSSAPHPPGESSTGPGTVHTEGSTSVAQAAPVTAVAAVAAVEADPRVTPAGGREPAHGVSAAAGEERGAVASAVAGGVLPFTGAPVWAFALLGFVLASAGLALLGAAQRLGSSS